MAIDSYIEILSKIRGLSHSEQERLLDELAVIVSSSPENLRAFPSLKEFRASIQLQGEPISETVIKIRKAGRD